MTNARSGSEGGGVEAHRPEGSHAAPVSGISEKVRRRLLAAIETIKEDARWAEERRQGLAAELLGLIERKGRALRLPFDVRARITARSVEAVLTADVPRAR